MLQDIYQGMSHVQCCVFTHSKLELRLYSLKQGALHGPKRAPYLLPITILHWLEELRED